MIPPFLDPGDSADEFVRKVVDRWLQLCGGALRSMYKFRAVPTLIGGKSISG